jgi:hypothetical protein
MAQVRGLSTNDKRFLASIVHQVWHSCHAFATIVMERGPEEGFYAMEELAEWSVAQRGFLGARAQRRPRLVTGFGLRVARELLDDVDTFCGAIGDMVARLEASSLDPDEVEEESLGIVEGFLTWTKLMASQLGITRNLKTQTLWHEG